MAITCLSRKTWQAEGNGQLLENSPREGPGANRIGQCTAQGIAILWKWWVLFSNAISRIKIFYFTWSSVRDHSEATQFVCGISASLGIHSFGSGLLSSALNVCIFSLGLSPAEHDLIMLNEHHYKIWKRKKILYSFYISTTNIK